MLGQIIQVWNIKGLNIDIGIRKFEFIKTTPFILSWLIEKIAGKLH